MITPFQVGGEWNFSDIVFRQCVLDDVYGLRKLDYYPTTIIDIGAHMGMFSVTAKILYPKATVIAVEPARPAYAALVINTSHMGVVTINKAYGPSCEMKYNPNNHAGTEATASKNPTVSGVYLQEIMSEYAVNPETSFIKLDCEGGEYWSLTSDLVHLAKFRRGAMEIHSEAMQRMYKYNVQADLQRIAASMAPTRVSVTQPSRLFMLYFSK